MKRSSTGRLIVLLVTMLFGLSAVVARLAVLQIQESNRFTKLGFDQRIRTEELPAARGEILDRDGTPLAMSIQAKDVYADPRYVTDPAGEALEIAPILGLRPRAVQAALSSTGTFAYVARQVGLDQAAKVEALHLPGIGFLAATRRSYPAGALAPQVLGFVGVDGTGLSGLEQQYQGQLAGTPGERTEEVSPNGLPIPQGVDVVRAPVPGEDVVTTIDRDLQFYAQQQLAAAVRANHAKGGTIIVMDPHTGEVYAMASYPWFDPNRYAASNPERWRNKALTDSFEPGSVGKVITAAAAVDQHAFPLDRRFAVPDHIAVGGYTIQDSHPHGVERMTLGDIVAESSNVGAVQVAEILGRDTMASYLARFGFGQPTGIGFPGETGGIVLPLSQWSDSTLATLAYGQGVSVTPMQMASVYATIANGGAWVQPQLVRGSFDAEGAYHPASAPVTRRVVSAQTASTITQMLAYVVANGTGVNAQIPGYQVAGKTGTALVPNPSGAGYLHKYVASFIGFLPASQPRVLIAAIIDEPTTIYGGIAAAPLFSKVARYAIQRLGIPAAADVGLPPHALNRG